MENYHPKKLELFFLIIILSPIMVTAEQNSQPLVGIILISLSFTFLMVTAIFAVFIHHGCLGSSATAATTEQQPPQETEEAAARGLEAAAIAALPSLTFSEIKLHRLGEGEVECAVCLYDFKDTETLRLLPDCFHVFHSDCIAPWLAFHVTCPVCRASLDLGQGSGVSMSNVLDRISGVSDHRLNHDYEHLTVEIEEISNEVDQNGAVGGKLLHRASTSTERLPRCHSTGQLRIRVVGEVGPDLSPIEISPTSKKYLNRWGCFATAPSSPNQTAR